MGFAWPEGGDPMAERKRLTDILTDAQRAAIQRAWKTAKAADEFKPIPAGLYRCRVEEGELSASRAGTPGYKLTFRVLDGEHAGRRVWLDLWFTDKAKDFARRDLQKLGFDEGDDDDILQRLERPLPEGIIADVKVGLRRENDGRE